MICVLHHNPIDPEGGGGVRTINILTLVKKIFNINVVIYALANDNGQRNFGEIVEKHIQKPFPLKKITGGYLCIFPLLIKRQLKQSEIKSLKPSITIFESPYLGYATLKTLNFPDNSIKIYHAHNVEINYWRHYTDRLPFGYKLLKKIRSVEEYILHNSDYVFATSEDEMKIFEEEYGINKDKLLVVPNGVDTSTIKPISNEQKRILKEKTGWGFSRFVVFMGSAVKANIDACKWIIKNPAQRFPDTAFIIIGSASHHLADTPQNVKPLGILSVPDKNTFLEMSDVAINPVLFGAGTNVKMLEYLAAGLPIITTPVGARGLNLVNNRDAIITNNNDFDRHISEIFNNNLLREMLGIRARIKAEEFDWNQIGVNIKKKLSQIL